MAQSEVHNDELEFVDDDFDDTSDFDDDSFALSESESSGISTTDDGGDNDGPFGLDFDDDLELSDTGKSKTEDTTAAEVRKGMDIQGLPWEKLTYTRVKYREARLNQYKNYENIPSSSSRVEEYKQVEKGYSFYDFQFNTRLVKPKILHFQLRNLLWATSKHDVYLMQNSSVMHWSALRKKSTEVLDMAKPVVPTAEFPLSLPQPLSQIQMSTMSVKDNLLVAGGFDGELICKHLNQPDVAFSTKMTTDQNAITNAIDIAESSSGTRWVIAANNDAQVRVFDAANFICISSFCFPWSVNNTSLSPDGRLMAVLGDSAECLVSDSNSGEVISILNGHLDYSFASAWHPDGRILATGNQDTTCRLWDVRNMSRSLDVLKGRMGAIRALNFTSDGRFMAMAEPADFVHIFDSRSGYKEKQEIDLFGEIAGISFSPDTEALFVGVADRIYGSVLEFKRKHSMGYLESVF